MTDEQNNGTIGTKWDHAALDRALCERLGIEGSLEHDAYCALEKYDWGNPWRTGSPKCTCAPTMSYPALSVSGDGMLLLMEAMLAKKIGWTITGDHQGIKGWAGVQVFTDQAFNFAPLALALAAARSLGVEVPELAIGER